MSDFLYLNINWILLAPLNTAEEVCGESEATVGCWLTVFRYLMFSVWSLESTPNLSKSDVLLGIKEFRPDNQIFSDIVNINIRFNYSSNTFQSQISLKFLH